MKIYLDKPELRTIIQAFDSHSITVDNRRYESSVILTPESIDLWPITHTDQLTLNHFSQLAHQPAEALILGCGACGVLIEASLTRPLIENKIGLEIMSTAAACRTWNILAGDGRQVTAALIIESRQYR